MNDDKMPGYLRLSVIQSCAVDDVLMTDTLLAVLVALGSYASEKNRNWLWAGQDTIARRMGRSRQAIGQATHELEALGYVEIQASYRDDGGRAKNWVRLKMDFELPDERRRDHAPRRKAGRGGRPKGTPPETPVVSYPPETPVVSPPETPVVSPPETALSFRPLKLNAVSAESGIKNLEMKLEKEPRARGRAKPSPSPENHATDGALALAVLAPPDVASAPTPPPPPPPTGAAPPILFDRSTTFVTWERAKLRIGRAEGMTPAMMDSWIKPLKIVSLTRADGRYTLTLGAPGTAAAQQATARFGGLIATTVGSCLNCLSVDLCIINAKDAQQVEDQEAIV